MIKARNLLTVSDEAFLADSVRCWQEAIERGDLVAFEYWAIHALMFALFMREEN